jgi:subtilase family serine protease
MVSAICPLCHIILVEAKTPSTANLGTAVNTAVSLGADFVSNSYGGSESSSDPTYDTDYYKHPGVAITASAGDSGYGVEYPATSQYVTAVGGTSLTAASNSRGWTETVWGSSSGGEGTGSGCSADDAKPSWQTDTGCAKRTNNDVAAVADPNTGLAIYDSYDQNGWLEVGGTSASSPIIASVFALAGTPVAGTYPSSYIYQHTSSLFDVTSGADGSCSPAYLCTAETGYDGPTGWGTPDGVTAFTG